MEPTIQRLPASPAAVLAALRRTPRTASRDPRAAPLSLRKSISIVETCRFYGAADALTSCRVPRSCQDCLAMPGCRIGFGGVCENVTESFITGAYKYDYHTKLTPSQPRGTAYGNASIVRSTSATYFFSQNATYCPSSDPVCTSCRAKFEAVASYPYNHPELLDGQFCVGDNGCVCVAICEIPSLLSARAYDRACKQPEPAPVSVASQRPPLPSISSRHRDPRAPLDLNLESPARKVVETCGFYGDLDIRGCREPRPCAQCLAREGCMLAGSICKSMDDYNPDYDFRKPNRSLSAIPSQFPSVNTTYCSASDATCAACRRDFRARAAKSTDSFMYQDPNTFCIGDDDCVCIELCENTPVFLKDARDTTCRVGYGVTTQHDDLMRVVVGVIAGVLLAGYIFWWVRDNAPPPRTPRPGTMWRHMLDHAPALPLDLFGWRRYQQQLRAKEDALLNGGDDVSPVARPQVDFDFVEASAPDLDVDDESTAPVLTDPHALASAPFY